MPLKKFQPPFENLSNVLLDKLSQTLSNKESVGLDKCNLDFLDLCPLMGCIKELDKEIVLENKQYQNNDESDLLSSNLKLSLAAEMNQLGFWEYNPKDNLFEFGNDFYGIFGTDVNTEGRFMNPSKYSEKFLLPEDVDLVLKDVQRFNETKDVFFEIIEHKIRKCNGEIRTVEVRRRAIRDYQGTLIKIYGTMQDVTENVTNRNMLIEQSKLIREIAFFDPLTGLANRRRLNEKLELELKSSKQRNAGGAVLFIDLDNLKMINDAYGHSYGDEIIVSVAKKMMKVLEEKNIIARIGGDEFVIILPEVQEHSMIESIIRKIFKSLNSIQKIYELSTNITGSLGVAIYPKDGETVEKIIKNADMAMYEAKRKGKNGWQYYDERLHEVILKRTKVAQKLYKALDNNEFFMVYQPILLQDGKIFSFEALIRWNTKDEGLISPAYFIPIAEEIGLMSKIGKWIIKEVCRFIKEIEGLGVGNIKIAANISPKQIVDEDFVSVIKDAVEKEGINPNHLELEITESVAIFDIDGSVKKLNQLKEYGINLSLDDFGTGFSSLNYLHKLPIEKIKIDKSFIDVISNDENSEELIKTMIKMGHTLNKSIVSEGVETEEQLSFLKTNLCDLYQGYLFSVPLEKSKAIEYLLDSKNN